MQIPLEILRGDARHRGLDVLSVVGYVSLAPEGLEQLIRSLIIPFADGMLLPVNVRRCKIVPRELLPALEHPREFQMQIMMIILKIPLQLPGGSEHLYGIGVRVDVVVTEGEDGRPQVESRIRGDPYSPRIEEEAVKGPVVLLDVVPHLLFSKSQHLPFSAPDLHLVAQDPRHTHPVKGVEHALLDSVLLLLLGYTFQGGLGLVQVEDDVDYLRRQIIVLPLHHVGDVDVIPLV